MNSFKNLSLIFAALCFIIVIGGAVYEHIVIIPQWSAAPPYSLTMFQGPYKLHGEHFWMAIHPVTLLFFILTLIFNWKSLRKKYILMSLIGYLITLIVTAIYYVPELIDITSTRYEDTVNPALTDRAQLWEMLSLFRLGFILILAGILLNALTKPEGSIQIEKV